MKRKNLTSRWFYVEASTHDGLFKSLFFSEDKILSIISSYAKEKYALTVWEVSLKDVMNNNITLSKEHFHFGDFELDGTYISNGIEKEKKRFDTYFYN